MPQAHYKLGIATTVMAALTALAAVILPGISQAACDCGSTNSAAPCKGNSVSLARGTTTIGFEFQCDGGACSCGKFANGWDYWVAPNTPGGYVSITAMTPSATGAADSTLRSGWVANPTAPFDSGMDGRLGALSAGQPLVPSASNPYTVITSSQRITSVVKSISRNSSSTCGATAPDGSRRFCFEQIEVLTVLDAVPESAGSTVLRPAYFGTAATKKLVSTNSIWFELLPSLPRPVRPDGTIATPGRTPGQALDYVKGFKIDWMNNFPGTQEFKATSSFPGETSGYSPGPWGRYWDALHWIVLDGVSTAQKRALAIWVVQHGEDALGILQNYPLPTGPWVPNGGHSVGRYGQAILAAALIRDGNDRAAWIRAQQSSDIGRQRWPETGQIFKSPVTQKVVYGAVSVPGGAQYTNCTTNVNAINADPQGLLDNSYVRFSGTNCVPVGEGNYQAIVFPVVWSQFNLLSSIPATRALADAVGIEYVRRVTSRGIALVNESYDNPLATCDGGINNGRYCLGNRDCRGATCVNRRSNWIDGTYNSFVGMQMWQAYNACYANDSCLTGGASQCTP